MKKVIGEGGGFVVISLIGITFTFLLYGHISHTHTHTENTRQMSQSQMTRDQLPHADNTNELLKMNLLLI